MTGFQQFLLEHEPAGRQLPLTHCTSGGVCFDILAELAVRPKPCAVYESELLYLFYGRPAFKPLQDLGASTLLETSPVCLVLDPGVVASAVRILPFDSGGFERYRDFVGPNLKREDFELSPDPTTPQRLIKAFFDTPRKYFEQQQRSPFSIPASQRAAAAFGRLIADPSIADDDDRRSTIEVQLDSPISLRTALKAIIAPSALLDDEVVVGALAACPDATPISYPTFGRLPPTAYASSIYERVERFLESEGFFG